jgi:hypothetical protein
MIETISVLIMIPLLVVIWLGAAAILYIFRRDFLND